MIFVIKVLVSDAWGLGRVSSILHIISSPGKQGLSKNLSQPGLNINKYITRRLTWYNF